LNENHVRCPKGLFSKRPKKKIPQKVIFVKKTKNILTNGEHGCIIRSEIKILVGKKVINAGDSWIAFIWRKF
jgi:hypothetical protein